MNENLCKFSHLPLGQRWYCVELQGHRNDTGRYECFYVPGKNFAEAEYNAVLLMECFVEQFEEIQTVAIDAKSSIPAKEIIRQIHELYDDNDYVNTDMWTAVPLVTTMLEAVSNWVAAGAKQDWQEFWKRRFSPSSLTEYFGK